MLLFCSKPDQIKYCSGGFHGSDNVYESMQVGTVFNACKITKYNISYSYTISVKYLIVIFSIHIVNYALSNWSNNIHYIGCCLFTHYQLLIFICFFTILHSDHGSKGWIMVDISLMQDTPWRLVKPTPDGAWTCIGSNRKQTHGWIQNAPAFTLVAFISLQHLWVLIIQTWW